MDLFSITQTYSDRAKFRVSHEYEAPVPLRYYMRVADKQSTFDLNQVILT